MINTQRGSNQEIAGSFEERRNGPVSKGQRTYEENGSLQRQNGMNRAVEVAEGPLGAMPSNPVYYLVPMLYYQVQETPVTVQVPVCYPATGVPYYLMEMPCCLRQVTPITVLRPVLADCARDEEVIHVEQTVESSDELAEQVKPYIKKESFVLRVSDDLDFTKMERLHDFLQHSIPNDTPFQISYDIAVIGVNGSRMHSRHRVGSNEGAPTEWMKEYVAGSVGERKSIGIVVTCFRTDRPYERIQVNVPKELLE